MNLKTMRSPLTRHPKNPILSPEDMPFPCYSVFNVGAILHEGEVILLLRVEDLTRATIFHIARSRDGINFTVEIEPVNRNAVLFPEKINGLYARLERPQDVNGTGRMWISYSPDLEFWGRSSPIPIPKTNWQLKKSGADTRMCVAETTVEEMLEFCLAAR
jgi:predicted GH43/DUF377 family glycosyl hydrolase